MSSSGPGSSAALAAKPVWCRPREREATRVAILDAANHLIELHGIEALSLSAVAVEIGLARATVYGFFSSKKQLLAQLSGEAPVEMAPIPLPAKPVAEMAAPVEVPEPYRVEEVAAAVVEPEPQPVEDIAPPADEAEFHRVEDEAQIEVVPVAAPVIDSDEMQIAPVLPTDDYDEVQRKQSEALERLAKRVITPKSMTKDGTDVVIARIETRVGMIEQSVTALEKRVTSDKRELAGQIGSTVDTVQQLQQRVENFRNQQQLAFAEMRLDIHNLSNGIKEPAQPIARRFVEKAPASPEPVAVAMPVDAANVQPPPGVAPANTDTPGTEPKNYLTSARRAAIEAAQQPSTKPKAKKPARQTMPRWFLGVAGIVVLAFGFYVYARSDFATGARADPVSQSAQQAVAQEQKHVKRITWLSGDDRLASLADAGNSQAQLSLGLKLLNGTGVAMNVTAAANWLERAAASGQPVAQNYVGVLYQTGTGVAGDMAQAIRWYEAAAKQGNVKAMANLGKIYAGGWKDGTDFVEAARWLSAAANLGDVDAQFDLAVLYERGEGVPQNSADAYKWYSVAAEQGDRNAAQRAEILRAQLMPEELEAAQKAVADFKPAPLNRAANDLPAMPATQRG